MSGKKLARLWKRKSQSWMMYHKAMFNHYDDDFSEQKHSLSETTYHLESAKKRYFRIWICNYILFIGLCGMFIALLLKLKSAASFIVMSVGIFLYGFLFVLNHANRIRKDENPTFSMYSLTADIMASGSKIGLVCAIIFLVFLVITY